MEQLRAVLGQIQIQPLLLQVVTEALMFLAAEPIFHPPIPLGQSLDREGDKTLAAMWRHIHDHKVEAIRLQLPLHDHKILGRGIVRPSRARFQDLASPSSHRGGLQRRQQLLVEGEDLIGLEL